MSVLSPLAYPLVLVLAGYAGILASLAAVKLVVEATGSGLASTIARLGFAAVVFLLWLYAWRRLAVAIRNRALRGTE